MEVAAAAATPMTSSKRLLTSIVVLATAASLFAAPEACAQDKVKEAQDHYAQGRALFKQRNYDGALKAFMAAFVLDPSPVLIYNIARAHEERGDFSKAIKFFKNYLRIARRARNARAVKRKIKKLNRRLANMPRTGYLTIVTDPPGALVHLNGQPIGQTPLNAKGVPVGAHQLEVFKERFDTHTQRVSVAPSQTTRIDVKLRDRPSTVLISTVPPGAVATVYTPAPKNLGPCPCVVELGAGRYRLQVQLAGFKPKDQVFEKQPGETLRVNVSLLPAQTMGKLVVDTNVPGAELRVDGRPAGRLPLREPLLLQPATVLVEVFAQGSQPWRGKARIETGRITRVVATLERAAAGVGVIPGPVINYPSGGGTSTQAVWGWVTTSIGIASLVAGGLTTTFSLLDQRTFDNSTSFPLNDGTLARLDLTMAEAVELEKRSKLLMNASYGLYAGGGVLLITGIILLATDGGPPNQSLSGTRIDVSPVSGGAVVGVQLPFD